MGVGGEEEGADRRGGRGTSDAAPQKAQDEGELGDGLAVGDGPAFAVDVPLGPRGAVVPPQLRALRQLQGAQGAFEGCRV